MRSGLPEVDVPKFHSDFCVRLLKVAVSQVYSVVALIFPLGTGSVVVSADFFINSCGQSVYPS